MKRALDIVLSLCGLLILSPVLLIISLLIFFYDFHSPFYVAPRVGKDGKLFRMIKFRSMVVDADSTGVTSTSTSDSRITPVGHFVRRCKLDEIVQLWNVLLGHMSLVGPRPNVKSGTDVYTAAERHLLSVRPGITDFASIVFADEGDILRGHADADGAYDRLIRPWKSRLGLFYIDHCSLFLDCKLIVTTILAVVSRRSALRIVASELSRRHAPDDLIRISLRNEALIPCVPPL
ncbi:sugar transferase [Steroidobacter denitrificans]|uniref:Sugar transferase n=1 Tax=Steroidobacter denitrificans TaxID=465721 RepID=A0A127FA09_STEDE|nr:sugar transferase [Steroidobacter denitrificans]AMN46438.1 sugar transferase [Steroidobacter denitrificans]